MNQIFVKADCFIVSFQSDCEQAISYIMDNLHEFSRLTITFCVLESPAAPHAVFSYYDEETTELSYIPEKTEYVLTCPWKKIGESTILPMVFRLIVELLRQDKKEIKLHASAVERNGKVALFVAPSEGGKTTTALAMCQRRGCLLRANDAAVLRCINNLPYFLRGDTTFGFRHNGLAAYSEELYENITNSKDTALPWYEKTRLSAHELGVMPGVDLLPVKAVFFVKLDPLVSGCKVTKYQCDKPEYNHIWFKPKMMILQNIAGTLRGVDLIPIGNDGSVLPLVIPTLDNEVLCQYRITFVNELFAKCEVYQLRGQLDAMIEAIDEVLSN